jgi:hypothetical protein
MLWYKMHTHKRDEEKEAGREGPVSSSRGNLWVGVGGTWGLSGSPTPLLGQPTATGLGVSPSTSTSAAALFWLSAASVPAPIPAERGTPHARLLGDGCPESQLSWQRKTPPAAQFTSPFREACFPVHLVPLPLANTSSAFFHLASR